ncbi:GMC family oxidoreductase [Yoonia sp. F2084L]|uniref:GMC oxidoreductase n=1 Tax=Yoonia sp. F2084L TaxID=2926419 RepID=UPI001FF45C64|nr:GMC family oxidoreductase [Yoonia sp. F2084L]MCK0093978.1 GMC family oxidoreductase [Yoonia sp. F2084L]
MTPQDALAQEWDVIVIGAGMGGGMITRSLAEQGLRVLVLERGPEGYAHEQQALNVKITDPHARHIRSFWPTKVHGTVDGRPSAFFAALGSGLGGSSVFYAGTLERPERHDLEPTDQMPHPTGGWPVGYDAFVPYFAKAEELLHISGTHDPLSTEPPTQLKEPPKIDANEAKMLDDLAASGLHPYRQHLALRNLPGCMSCLGRKCPRNCKMDGRSAGIVPALATGNAHVLTECTATQIRFEAGQVTGVDVSYSGAETTLKARTYVLAAGALHSPRLLLKSQDAGGRVCANSSDWVGRGLMFHLNEMFALWPKRDGRFSGATKAISSRDLYAVQGSRMGTIQSMGLPASFGNIAAYLAGRLDQSPLRRLGSLRYLTNIVALIAARIMGEAKVFVGIVEDLPYPENRVLLHDADPDMPCFTYTLKPELLKRRQLFRQTIKKRFRGFRPMLMGLAPQLNYGHPCGTLRFGSDSKSSVFDADCRSHDLDNLYIADASFFPTSMGVNPSLMIAANALRVGDIIATRAKSEINVE